MRYDYLQFFKSKLRELAGKKRVLDVGGGAPFQKQMSKYRSWFQGVRFETMDVSTIYNPSIVGDIHAIPLADLSIDAILCKSVLEHVTHPEKAVGEMHRILKPGGQLLLYTHFVYPYHPRLGIYGDYFRYTEAGLRHLFRNFSSVEIKKQGGWFLALSFFLPLQARLRFFLEPAAYLLDKLFR